MRGRAQMISNGKIPYFRRAMACPGGHRADMAHRAGAGTGPKKVAQFRRPHYMAVRSPYKIHHTIHQRWRWRRTSGVLLSSRGAAPPRTADMRRRRWKRGSGCGGHRDKFASAPPFQEEQERHRSIIVLECSFAKTDQMQTAARAHAEGLTNDGSSRILRQNTRCRCRANTVRRMHRSPVPLSSRRSANHRPARRWQRCGLPNTGPYKLHRGGRDR